MHKRSCFLGLLVVCGGAVLADEPVLGPAVEGYGPTYLIEDRDVPLAADTVYRAVFDVASHPGDVSRVSRRLESVARFLNMHVRNETPLDNMDLAVVVHGGALKSLLTHEAYNERFDMDNPNLQLVSRLHEAGVDFYVCGQSLAFGGIDKGELVGSAQIALSAMTMLTVLQNDGYALLPD